MSEEQIDEMLEPENQDESASGWSKIKEELGPMESLGATMAGVSVPIIGAPSRTEKAKEMVPEDVSVAGKDIDVHGLTEDLYNFKNEWIIGHSWETDHPLKEITLTADKLGHYSVGYLGASLTQRAVDRMSGDYDPKKVALGGMMAVPIYAVAKEGWYEGGSGIQFNLESMDVRGDIMMDTMGALHSVYNYHKKKTAAEGEEPKGVVRSAAHMAGRAYGQLEKGIGDGAGKVSESIEEYSISDYSLDMPELDISVGSDSSSETEPGSLGAAYDSDSVIDTPSYSPGESIEKVTESAEESLKGGVEKASEVKTSIGDSISSGISSLTSGFGSSSSRGTGSQSLDEVYG